MPQFTDETAPVAAVKHRDVSSSTEMKASWVSEPPDPSSTVPKHDEQDAPKRKWAMLKAALGVAAVLAIPTAETRRRWDEAGVSPLCFLGAAEAQTSATAPSEAVAELRNSVVRAFRRARFEFFEEGTDSTLATELWDILGRFAALKPVDVIAQQVLTCGLPPSLGAEALRALGRVHDRLSLEDRKWFAEQAIRFSAHPALRYGAALALATIDDAEARQVLQEATARENLVALRRNMEQMVQQLREE